jgi:hypothetical protein
MTGIHYLSMISLVRIAAIGAEDGTAATDRSGGAIPEKWPEQHQRWHNTNQRKRLIHRGCQRVKRRVQQVATDGWQHQAL